MTDDEHSKIMVLEERLSNFMQGTIEFRLTLSEKIDKLNDSMNKLPCAERKGWYISINNQIRLLWGLTGAIVLAVVSEWVKR